MTLFDSDHDEVSGLIGAYLNEVEPRHGAKRLARRLRFDPRTIESYKAGNAPGLKAFLRMVAEFGPAFSQLVLAPALNSYEARKLDDDLSELEAWIAAEKVRRGRAKSGG